MKPENHFMSKEIWDSKWLISRERSEYGFKQDFTSPGTIEPLSEFWLGIYLFNLAWQIELTLNSLVPSNNGIMKTKRGREESIEWFIEARLSRWRMIRLLSQPPLLSASCLSFLVFIFVAGRAYWRERGGWDGGGAISYDSKKAWSSVSHSILSGRGGRNKTGA